MRNLSILETYNYGLRQHCYEKIMECFTNLQAPSILLRMNPGPVILNYVCTETIKFNLRFLVLKTWTLVWYMCITCILIHPHTLTLTLTLILTLTPPSPQFPSPTPSWPLLVWVQWHSCWSSAGAVHWENVSGQAECIHALLQTSVSHKTPRR